MGYVYGSKLWQKTIAIILIFSIPVALINYDYSNDQLSQREGEFVSYNMVLNETIDRNIFSVFPGIELPLLSDVNLYVNFSVPTQTGPIIVTILEDSQYAGFLAGTYPENQLFRDISGVGSSKWINYTTGEEGEIRIAFTYENPESEVEINGIYNFETEGYLSRNFGIIFSSMGIYVIIAFGLIPSTYRRVRINQLKRRKQMERIEEEEKFYKNLDN